MKQYDVIVIGAGIAGLGVAGMLQSKGLSTLVLEKSTVPGGRSKTRELPGGWHVDSGTHCVHLAEHSPCAKLLQNLGGEISWSRPIEGLMVFKGEQWVSVAEYLGVADSDAEELTALEDRFFQLTEDEIDSLDTVSLAQFITENVGSEKVAEYLKIIGMIQTTLTQSENISMGEFAWIYREGMKLGYRGFTLGGVKMPRGGISEMIGSLAEACTSRGGTIECATPVRKVAIPPGGPITVMAEHASYSAHTVVLALPIWKMVEIISPEEGSPLPGSWYRTMQSLKGETSASMGFTVGTSSPLFNDLAYLSSWRIPGVDLPLQILGHTNFDETIAPPNHMIAFMGTPCTPAQALDEEFRTRALALFWEEIERMFPGIDEKLLWKADGYYVGIDGLGRSPGLTGKHRPQVFHPEVPGLYFAGDCYTGRGIGMNAAANSAFICAERILADLEKR